MGAADTPALRGPRSASTHRRAQGVPGPGYFSPDLEGSRRICSHYATNRVVKCNAPADLGNPYANARTCCPVAQPMSGATASERAEPLGLVGAVFGAILGQSNSIVMGGRPGHLSRDPGRERRYGVPASRRRTRVRYQGSAIRRGRGRSPACRRHHRGHRRWRHACRRRPGLPRWPHRALRHSGFPSRHVGLASFEVGLALFGPFAYGESQSLRDQRGAGVRSALTCPAVRSTAHADDRKAAWRMP